MNKEKLLAAESRFLLSYPEGFNSLEMQQLVKKHAIDKFVKWVKEGLSNEQMENWADAVLVLQKIVVGSSLVSVFEKTAFRNMIANMNAIEKQQLVSAYRELLHGDQAQGFQSVTGLLAAHGNAKWPIITSVLYYSNPYEEVIVKPSTVKKVIELFELEQITYTTKPDYTFYNAYRAWVIRLKSMCGPELQVDNGAYSGFLMFALDAL